MKPIQQSIRVLFLSSLIAASPTAAEVSPVPDALSIYDQTMDTVTRKFYDQSFRGLPWATMVATSRGKLSGTVSDEKLNETINDLLMQLQASHTEFLSAEDQEYWALESVFSHKIDGAAFRQIGAWFVKLQGRWFIRNVFRGSPAENAGFLSGDEIISANDQPFEPVGSFADTAAPTVRIAYRRSPDSPERVVEVAPESRSVQNALLAATQSSTQTFLSGHNRIGYFHLWAGTHPAFQAALQKAAQELSLETDAMILDLRDGFGGSGPAYLNPFFDHDDSGHPVAQVYGKPMVVLINSGTRSGKEWLTYIIKTTKRATLLGSKTAGYFRPGQPFKIQPNRFLLYLAVKGDGPPLPAEAEDRKSVV